MIFLWLILATLVSEDLACLGAGWLAARGEISFLKAVLACVTGILIGDIFLYLAGRHGGRPVFRWFVSDSALAERAAWFHRHGPPVLWITRFVPGTRLPTYLAAGVLQMGFWRFTGWLLAAGLVWTPLLIGVAMIVGHNAERWFGYYQVTVVALLGVWLAVKLFVPLCTWRGRRLALGRWRRLTQWEFWPLWVFYPPVVGYILWLGLRHGSFTLFTIANPAIPAGGLIGESKSEILAKLPPECVARYELVSAPPATYPIVLKPDTGQRGLGVAIVRTRDEAAAYFRVKRGPTIAQEYVPGVEFGIFYYRYPNAATGHIFSITEKCIPTVTGDGHSTLEELILRDNRAVCQARLFLNRHAARLQTIPTNGEVVTLGDLGTHCRGAIFRDGAWLKTPALEAAIDRISRRVDGFFIGRYDIRAASADDLRRGINFKIIELNGVSSEATHIYQPGTSLRAAYRTLRRQWEITFAIAAQNRDRGLQPLPIRDLVRLIVQYRPASEA